MVHFALHQLRPNFYRAVEPSKQLLLRSELSRLLAETKAWGTKPARFCDPLCHQASRQREMESALLLSGFVRFAAFDPAVDRTEILHTAYVGSQLFPEQRNKISH